MFKAKRTDYKIDFKQVNRKKKTAVLECKCKITEIKRIYDIWQPDCCQGNKHRLSGRDVLYGTNETLFKFLNVQSVDALFHIFFFCCKDCWCLYDHD